MIIAIDGPSGAGKSSIAKSVAEQLGFRCLDTGAMFRSIALKALRSSCDLQDDSTLCSLMGETDISFEYASESPYPSSVLLDGEDVTTEIRTAEVDKAVTPVCQQPSVREALLDMQRAICANGNYVVDGRDIGTVVFPDAEIKIYLDATPEERARRRVEQNKERGIGNTDMTTVITDIKRRDHADSTRTIAPLSKASDAVLIDSTHMTFDDVVDKICHLASQH